MLKKGRAKSLAEILRSKISGELREASILVWYDPEGSFHEIVPKLKIKEANLLCFEGSYLKIREEIEDKDPKLEGKWVIYIPEKPPQPSWLRDLELAGRRIELSLRELIFEKAGLFGTPSLRWLLSGERGKLLARRWDEFVGSIDEILNEGRLKEILIFCALGIPAGFGPGDLITSYLEDPEEGERRLSQFELQPIFREYIRENLGLPNLPEEGEISLNLAAALFLSELVEEAGASDPSFDPLLPSPEKRGLWKAWLRKWAETGSRAFRKWALKVERTYAVEEKISGFGVAGAIGLPCVDRVLLREVEGLLEVSDHKAFHLIEKIALKRFDTPWARWKEESEAPLPWKGLLYAFEVLREAEKAKEELKSKESWPLEELFDLYAAKWWKLDSALLFLEAAREAFSLLSLKKLAERAVNAYLEYLELLARRTAKALEERGEWSVRGWKGQHEVFRELVETEEEKIALLLMDALRFDLARKLCEKLRGKAEIKEVPYLASLPSITQVGMAMLIPSTEPLEIEIQESKLVVRKDGFELSSPSDRGKLWKKSLPQIEVLTLEELLRKADIPEKPLLVLSSELDELGHPKAADEILGRVTNLVITLLERGFSKVVILSDHGFLWLPMEWKPKILQIPYSSDLVIDRRFILGKVLPHVEDTLRLSLSSAHMKSEAWVLFPKGLAVFSHKGPISPLLHGGFLPQETALLALEVKALARKEPIEVVIAGPERIDSILPIFTLEARAKGLSKLTRGREVQIVVFSEEGEEIGRSEVLRIEEPGRQYRTKPVKLKAPKGEVKVRVIDTRDNSLLCEKEIKVVLLRGFAEEDLWER